MEITTYYGMDRNPFIKDDARIKTGLVKWKN